MTLLPFYPRHTVVSVNKRIMLGICAHTSKAFTWLDCGVIKRRGLGRKTREDGYDSVSPEVSLQVDMPLGLFSHCNMNLI